MSPNEPNIQDIRTRLFDRSWRLGCWGVAYSLATLLMGATSGVPSLTIVEGGITGLGTYMSGVHWVLIEGKRKMLYDAYPDLEHGDWVKVACTAKCYIWEVRK